MARLAHNDVLDALLDEIATANEICVCSQEPATRAEANSTYALAATAMTPGAGGASYDALADGTLGTAGGRKLGVKQQDSIDIDSTGTANHIALVDGTNLLFVTTATAQPLTSGGEVTIPAFIIEVEDPTAP